MRKEEGRKQARSSLHIPHSFTPSRNTIMLRNGGKLDKHTHIHTPHPLPLLPALQKIGIPPGLLCASPTSAYIDLWWLALAAARRRLEFGYFGYVSTFDANRRQVVELVHRSELYWYCKVVVALLRCERDAVLVRRV